jgi:glutamate N-acetyltransferase/amino-acid N-acetyltransferase
MTALNTQLGVNFPRGFRSAGVYCGIKKPGLLDLALIVSERAASVAGVFTTNRACAAPVRWSKQVVAGGVARAIIANSGNANCLTGEQGERDAQHMAELVARRLGCPPTQVVVASTGVIGVPLPMNAVETGIALAFERLSDGDDRTTADAILTTDSASKRVSLPVDTPVGAVRLGAIAKGAGMIAPKMATMLAFITTDAVIAPADLQACLTRVVDATFNCITVDGDTSTNDMVIALANGASGVRLTGDALQAFEQGLHQVCEYLAKRIVKDGEGARPYLRGACVGRGRRRRRAPNRPHHRRVATGQDRYSWRRPELGTDNRRRRARRRADGPEPRTAVSAKYACVREWTSRRVRRASPSSRRCRPRRS